MDSEEEEEEEEEEVGGPASDLCERACVCEQILA